jgi:transposase
MRLLYLPPYSPDLNPIKEAFSAIKAWMRANHDYISGEMEGPSFDPYTLIWKAVYGVVTPEKAYSWYKHSEYIA